MAHEPKDLSVTSLALAGEIEAALANGHVDVLAPEALQALMSALCRTYTAHCELGADELPLQKSATANATDIMTTAAGLLRAANVAVFEFAMWQSWGGR